jgi:hypothetical protein
VSIELAFNSPIFLRYLVIVGGLLACAGVVLGALHLVGRNVASPLRTYRGWLVMIPIVLGTLFLGREATILGVTLLAAIGFKEFQSRLVRVLHGVARVRHRADPAGAHPSQPRQR